MRPQVAGWEGGVVRYDQLPSSRAKCHMICRVLCCSVALYALLLCMLFMFCMFCMFYMFYMFCMFCMLCVLCSNRAGYRIIRVSFVCRAVRFPSSIGASYLI
jgi:hypothetical protein